MKTNEVVRAWKDENYRETLTPEHRAKLPQHPSGTIEFEQPELEDETPLRPGAHKYSFHCTHKCYTARGKGC